MIYSMAMNGFFGRLMTSYSKVNGIFKSSASVSLVGNGSQTASFVRRIRFKIAELFDKSAMLYLWRRIAAFFVGCRIRFYGSFTVIFAIYTALIYLVKRYAFSVNYSDNSYLLCAILLFIMSLPMLASRKTVAQILTESHSGHFIVKDFLGIPEEKLDVEPAKHGDSYNIAIVAGLLTGTLTYFVNPVLVLLLMITLLVIALVLTYPEIGVVLVSLLLPFLSITGSDGTSLYFIITLYSFGYFIKLLRGKRILKVDIYDFVMLIFGAVLLFGGIVSVGGEASASTAYRMFILTVGSFVALNLLRTANWIKRCAIAIFCSAFTVSLIMLWQFFAKIAKTGMELSVFDGSPIPFFDSREALSAYLLMAFAITLSSLPMLKSKKARFVVGIGALCMLGTIVSVACKSAIVGAVLAILVYFVITRKKTVTFLISSFSILLYACFMLPVRFINGIAAAFKSMMIFFWRAVSVWQGTMGIILASFFGGIGVDAFSAVYPRFSLAGSEGASETSSLLLRILCDVGIVGIIVFAIVLLLFLQNCFEYIKSAKDKSRLVVAGGLCGIIGVLCQSFFFDIWSNMGIFYAFWLVMTVTVAAIRVGKSEHERNKHLVVQNDSRASVDLL